MSMGRPAGGHCVSRIQVIRDDRLRFIEDWSWESREGSGQSVVEEMGENNATWPAA